jgi:hypothetical protein
MKLNVMERLLLLGMQEIPRFGNIVTMGVVTDMFARLQFTEKEIEEGEMQFSVDEATGKSNVRWNPTVTAPVEIDITPGMAKILVAAMEKVPEDPGLSISLVPVYRELKATCCPPTEGAEKCCGEEVKR